MTALRHRVLLPLAILLALAPFTASSALRDESTPKDGPGAAPLQHLVLLERGPNWPSDPSAPSMGVLAEHGAYMHALFEQGKVIGGGPAADFSSGIAIFAVADRAEVDRLLAADPAVRAGLFAPQIRAFHAALTAGPAPEPTLPAAPRGLAPIRHAVVVPAPLADVWHAWSTAEGAQSFFAPEVVLELAPLGAFEVRFSPENPPGERGAEGLRVLAYLPERMLAFEWNAPPQFARARPERTFVVVELEPLGATATRVVLVHQGFAEQAARVPELADEWKGVRTYFDAAWPTVLANLAKRFTSGPLDWAALREPAK